MPDSPWVSSYESLAERIEDLCPRVVRPDVAVPSCPGWTARDLIGHLAGLTEDWVAGNLVSYASPEWTTRHVARFAGQPVAELFGTWRDARRSFAALPDSSEMGDPAMWALGDALVHEADLHEALGRGTRPPMEAVTVGLKFGVARWRAHLPKRGVPSLRIDVVDAKGYWCGEPDDAAPVLRVDTWGLFRLLYGRRSRSWVAASVRQGSPQQLIEAGLPYPFEWSAVDLAG